MNDEEYKRSLSDSYQMMMNLSAWKDLEAYAESERNMSFSRTDSKSAEDLNINFLCEERGIRKGIAKIMRYALQRKDGI